MKLAKDSVTEGSRSNYDTHFKKWVEFLEIYQWDRWGQFGGPNLFLQLVTTNREKADILGKFVTHLHENVRNSGTVIASTMA